MGPSLYEGVCVGRSVDRSVRPHYGIDEVTDKKKASYGSALRWILALRLFLSMSVRGPDCI